MEYLNSVGHFTVRSSMNPNKLVKSKISNYIEVHYYSSFIDFLKDAIRKLKKQGFEYQLNDLILNKSQFEQFKKKYVSTKFSLSHNDIWAECWIVNTYKKGSPIRVYQRDPNLDIMEINELLKDYGYKDNRPKYELMDIIEKKE